MNKYFKSAEEFDVYVKQYKPTEIWLDDFSLEKPYIQLRHREDDSFGGCYTNQCLLGGSGEDYTWLYEENLYIKL